MFLVVLTAFFYRSYKLNKMIFEIESKYKDFSGEKVKFAAISDEIWKKEVEKYRFNLKNYVCPHNSSSLLFFSDNLFFTILIIFSILIYLSKY